MHLNRVFVYGALKRGGRFHGVLQRAHFLGEARTCESYLLHVGWQWPLLVEAAPVRWRAPVCGEVYEVSPLLLRKLDAIEDNGRLYQRKPSVSSWKRECAVKPGATLQKRQNYLN